MQKEFIRSAIEHLETSFSRVEICLEKLDEKEIWQSTNENTNSIANLILHLCGNITQYITSTLGTEEDKRKRDLEFNTESGYDKKQLNQKLKLVTEKAVATLNNLTTSSLEQIHKVQGFQLSGIAIISHVVEHYSYHVGQIALYTKLIKNQDLGFYAGMDLNITE